VTLQPPLFDLPEPSHAGWHPRELRRDGRHLSWMPPAELGDRLDASYYVITRRPERLLAALPCPLVPLAAWADVNPPARRLPSERGFLLYERCCYAEIRDVREDCWAVGPELRSRAVRDLPTHASHQPEPGDILLPRYTSSLHKAVVVRKTGQPLVASENFILLQPRRWSVGPVLLALLHHRVLGEQLWALATGTMKLAVAAGQVGELRVPQLPEGTIEELGSLVERLIEAQVMAAYPGTQFPLPLYWQDGTLFQWRQRSESFLAEISHILDEALSI
jgi:hypothetical protein